MPMRFPKVEDVPLGKPPLTEVICQVRFPPILSIGRGQPVEFQEAIRKRFPEVEEEQNLQVRVTAGVGPPASSAEISGRSFHFRTPDGGTLVSLTADAYAISTSQYTAWDDFAKDLELVHGAAMATYALPYAKRVGLRYVNQLDAQRTGCESFDDLKAFLRPELAGLMATDAWDRPEELVWQVILSNDGGRLLLRIAARATDGQPPFILLDFDYFEEGQIPLGDLAERCDRYHDVIYRAFRWAFRPDNLEVFAPMPQEA